MLIPEAGSRGLVPKAWSKISKIVQNFVVQQAHQTKFCHSRTVLTPVAALGRLLQTWPVSYAVRGGVCQYNKNHKSKI